MATPTSTGIRSELHALVDALADGELDEAKRYLTGLSTTSSLERKLLLAPLEDEDLSPGESTALTVALGRYRSGDVTYASDEELARELGE